MSSRKAAAAKTAVRRGTAAPPVAKPAGKGADAVAPASTASAEAIGLATEIERGLREGRFDTLTPQAFQVLMAALCKSYAAQSEGGEGFMPLADRNSVSPTEIMTTTSALLKSANLAVFELGMWQSWTGR